MTIQFCGADKEVTGSCHKITLEDGYTILLDCGLYQGYDKGFADFNETWLFEPAHIDCVLLSHAHIDHCGRLPKLIKDGFNGMIYCTHATRELATILLFDSAGIQERDAAYDNKRAQKNGKNTISVPLYNVEHVRETLKHITGYSYENWIRIRPSVEFMFRDVGHILGSASITLRITENGKITTLGFTGDIGRPNRPILSDPLPMPQLDYLICESTYGSTIHPQTHEEISQLIEVITDTCINRKGKVIIPAFSVGRTQEVLFMLDQLVEEKRLPAVPVYVDSPLAMEATDIFLKHPECFDTSLHDFMLKDPDPFGFKNLTYIRAVEDSKKLNASSEPCIIISASGMANAGRVRHHIANNVEFSKNTILIVGYAAPETPAGQLREGKPYVEFFNRRFKVNAQVVVMESFSAHADYKEMLAFLDNQKISVRKMWLVHGEFEVQEKWRQHLLDAGFIDVAIPALNETVNFNALAHA